MWGIAEGLCRGNRGSYLGDLIFKPFRGHRNPVTWKSE